MGCAFLLASLVTNLFAQSLAGKVYTIANNNDANMFIQDNGGSVAAVGSKNANSYWQFVPTANADCYYIQNAKTGKYLQGYSASEQEVAMGDSGVEYYVVADGDGTYQGKFRMSCTANTPHDFSGGTLGLNWKGNNTVQSFASVTGGNPRSAWIVTEASLLKTVTGQVYFPGSDIYLYNVESGLWLQNNDSKMNDWSTRGAIGTRGLDFVLNGSNNEYTIGAKFGRASINPDNNYLDTDNNPAWEFHVYDAKIAEGISNPYTINCGNKVLGTVKYNEANKQNNLFTQEGDDRWYLENPDYNINMSERITWQLWTKEERLAKVEAEASATNPVDVSWLIPSADFANNDTRYNKWTRNYTQLNNEGNLVRGGDEHNDQTRGSMIIESWHSGSIDMYTTLTDIPNGIYRMTVQGYYRDGDRSQVITRRNDGTETIRSYYYANEVSHPFMSILDGAKTDKVDNAYDYNEGGYWYPDGMTTANRCFNLHKGYVNDEIEVTVTGKTLKLGVLKTEGVARDWTVFDNFHLTYLGPVDISAYIDALNQALTDAQNTDCTNASTAVKNLMTEAIAEGQAALSSTDTDVLSDATAKLLSAISAANGMDVSLLQATITVAEAEGVDVTAANDVVENAMTKSEVDNALYELQTARKIYAQGFADVYTGAAPAADQEFFLYNIGTGMWLNHGSDWNTHAAVDVYPLPVKLIAAEDGKYKMQTHMFKNREEKYINWGAYVDTPDQNTWTFNPVDGKTNVYTINSEGNRTDVGRLLGYDPYGPTDRGSYLYWSTVAKDRENVNNPNNQWKLVTKAEIEAMMDNASAANPVDVSYLIDNGGLSRVWSLDNWTKQCDGGNGGAHVSVGDDNNFDRNSDYGYEVWNANSFSFTQELNNLKPGIYQVGVSGFFRQGDGGFQAGVVNDGGALISEAYLEANGEKQNLPNIATEAGNLPGIFTQNSNNGTFANWPAEALKAFESGLYKTSVQAIVNYDGKLTLGVKQDQKTTDNSWALFDTFRLYYLGEEPITSMSVVGDFFTTGFDPANGLAMTQDTNNPAIWTATLDDFVVEYEQGQNERTYEYKVTANGKWGRYELPAQGSNPANQNWRFADEAGYPAGIYKFVFTADTENHTLTLDVVRKVTLDENATDNPIATTKADVTLNRAFNAGWNAVCLPFDADAFDGGVIVEMDSQEADGENNIKLKFKSATSFKANVPYLVNFPAAVAAGKVFEGVSFQPGEVIASGDVFNFIGTYVASEVVKAGDYVISGGELKKASQAITLKGTRTFFQLKEATPVRSVTLSFGDDVPTGIMMIEDGALKVVNSIYNLNGQKVSQPGKGLYIVDGKKVIK